MYCSGYAVKVPGKLMIAGEYAVLEPYQKAVVTAIDRYVTATIKPSKINSLCLPQLGLENITWRIKEGKVEFSKYDKRLSFIENSILTAIQFLEENSIRLSPFQLELSSELYDALSGQKYGLGSSAAVVTAVTSAIIKLHSGKESLNFLKVFKLSSIAHVRTQKSGSGADIAAAVYGGWLEYSTFDSKWLLEELKEEKSISSLIEKPWPYLFIKDIIPPKVLKLAVGWTRQSVATVLMIKSFENYKKSNIESYNEFLKESSAAVGSLIQSFELRDCTGAIVALSENRKILQKLGEKAGVNIENHMLKRLCSIAENYGSGKPSGAGGGDCGIAFVNDDFKLIELNKAWKASDIVPLDIIVSKDGISIESL